MEGQFYRSQAELRPFVGMVVPTWFPAEFDPAEAAAVMRANLADLETVVEPRHCIVVADGSTVAAATAEAVRDEGIGCRVLLLEDGPHGKGGAVAHGLRVLLGSAELRWFVVRDHDGDHFLSDAPRLIRMGLQLEVDPGVERILVNGGRRDPGRPMGWVRAEYERLVNAVVWRGLHYHAARNGRAVDERFLDPCRDVPDLQSGYKCYSRAAAEHIATASLAADWPMRRWGCEVLSTVEVVATGGVFAEVQRAALDQQPLTTYEGDAQRARLHGDILCWTARRLDIPAAVVLSWFDAAVARSALRTQPSGRREILDLRRYVAATLDPDGDLREKSPVAPWFC